MGSPGKNIKAALLFFFLYLIYHLYQCYLVLYFIYIKHSELIFYFLFNFAASENSQLMCVLFSCICFKISNTATSFMVSRSSRLKHQLLVQFYYLGVAFKNWTFLDILAYCHFLFQNTHYIIRNILYIHFYIIMLYLYCFYFY